MRCELCEDTNFIWSNVGLPDALECTHCGTIASVPPKPWIEITKGQIDDCLKHSDNYGSTPYDFAWAIEAICKKNNGY